MSEDKMREEFHKLCPHSLYPSEAYEAFVCAWKACAAIKDSENAKEIKSEIAARDLMIKELRVALIKANDPYSNLGTCITEALATSEHHNSRALEKMLLEAEIRGMRNSSIESQREANAKLAKLNKE